MKRTWFSRRGFLVAGFVSAAMMFGGGSGSAGENAPEPEEPAVAVAQPAVSPLDKPIANFLPKGWEETQAEVRVEFSDITRDGTRMTAEVTLANIGEKTVKGPFRVVIDDIRVEGLKLSNASGEIGNHLQYVDLLVKGKSLAGGKKQVRKLTLESKTQLEEDALVDFAPRFRVLVQADPSKGKQDELAFTQEELDKTIEKQNKLDAMLKPGTGNKDIFGTSTALDENGKLYIAVYARVANPGDVPAQMDGTPVRVELKGPFFSDDRVPGKQVTAEAGINTDARFSRPVPLGVGIGREVECGWVGTLGARVTRNGGKCLLSNYHVLVPKVIRSTRIMQPAGCTNVSTSNSLGSLTSYYPITFSTSASNRYDAALATTTTSLVGTRPANNYGTLGSVQTPTLGMYVHKFGRTTQYTKGRITAVNVTINVSYTQGTARFIGCVQYVPTAGYSQFSAGGDSGSLVTQQGTNNGVALHFAGSGATSFGCPLPGLMSGFRATLDR